MKVLLAGLAAAMVFATGCRDNANRSEEGSRQTVDAYSDRAENELDRAKEAQAQAEREHDEAQSARQDVESKERELRETQQELSQAQQEAGTESSEAMSAQQQAQQVTQNAQNSAAQAQEDALRLQREQQQQFSQQQSQAAQEQSAEAKETSRQQQQQAQAAPTPPAQQQSIIEGRVETASADSLVLQTNAGDRIQLEVDSSTQVLIDGEQRALSDIQEGAQVRASLDSEQGSTSKIEVQQQDQQPAPQRQEVAPEQQTQP